MKGNPSQQCVVLEPFPAIIVWTSAPSESQSLPLLVHASPNPNLRSALQSPVPGQSQPTAGTSVPSPGRWPPDWRPDPVAGGTDCRLGASPAAVGQLGGGGRPPHAAACARCHRSRLGGPQPHQPRCWSASRAQFAPVTLPRWNRCSHVDRVSLTATGYRLC